jgi:transcription elongation factor GreA
MVDKTQYMTREGYETLKKRFNYLTRVRRPEIAERVRTALEDGGDLTENTEYEDAKNEQAMLEGEIVRIETILRNAQIIEDPSNADEVLIGSQVTIVEKGTDDEEVYRIVSPADANPAQGKLSMESPLGSALMGKQVGDKVKIAAPDGDITFIVRVIG